MQGSFDDGAEAATAAAAAEAGMAFTLSTGASMTIEQVAKAAGQARWFQLYFVTRDRQVILDLVRRAEAAGYTALCVTVDNPVHGFRRWALRRGGSTRRQDSQLGNLAPYAEQIAQAAVTRPPALDRLAPPVHFPATWDDIRWLRSQTELPIVLKGILHPEDAATAMEIGLQGVFVSNHGGRQLDHGISTLEALPRVAAAVHARGGVVLMDGGVRSAPDAAIALALGADAVGLGRPVLWALAVGGQRGVSSYLTAFRTELLRTLQLLGLTGPAGLSAEHVERRTESL
jgi:4-hydroxymandelate oxidase